MTTTSSCRGVIFYLFFFFLVSSFSSTIITQVHAQGVNGNSECPCLSWLEVNGLEYDPLADFWTVVGPQVDESTYGIGCYAHDEFSNACANNNVNDDCSRLVPLPENCDKSFCRRSWCYVDESCPLKSRPSTLYGGRYYSYATCGELDSFTFTDRLKSLKGEVFKVGFASNSGGWKGAFHPSGQSFTIDNKWEGPVVDFVRTAAFQGGFTINMTEPPSWIQPMSEEFFGSNSFDYCVYATSLGYLDFCVGGFSITEKRSSVTTMFETTSDPYFLIVFTEDGRSSAGGGDNKSSQRWDSFLESLVSLFQPFTGPAWALILLGVLPCLGCLMLFHEYGAPGSSYPTSEPVMIIQQQQQQQQQRNGRIVQAQIRPVPITKNLVNAFYTGVLSFFNGSFDLAVVTPGGKIALLAISFFIMIILAVYTANLAAILTQTAQRTSVNSIEDAIKAGYNFCAERKLSQIIMDSYNVDATKFVPDPIDLGGDGQPGFNCPNCDSRTRVLEYMRRSHNDNTLYCNAAISKIEDLEVFQSTGDHCDKVKVGDALGYQTIGIPIFEDTSPQLSAIFHQVKNEGAMTKALVAATPQNECPVPDEEGSALTISQLTGVWVVTGGFVWLSLVVKCFFSFCRCNSSERGLRRYDQWLNLTGNDVIVGGYRFDAETNELLGEEEEEEDDDQKEDDNEKKKDDSKEPTEQVKYSKKKSEQPRNSSSSSSSRP